MKKLSFFLAMICTVCMSAFSQAFIVYPKGNDKPDIILNNSISRIYFDTTEDGKLRQNFDTFDGLISYNVDDIDRMAFKGEKYIKVNRHNFILPKETCVINIEGYSCGEQSDKIEFPKSDSYNIWTSYGFLADDVYWFKNELMINENNGPERTFTIPYKAGDYYDEIHVKQHSESFLSDYSVFSDTDGRCLIVGPEKQVYRIPVLKEVDLNLSFYDTSSWIKANNFGDGFITLDIDENKEAERNVESDFCSNSIKWLDGGELRLRQLKSGMHSVEEHMAALKDFYDTCGGENWTYQQNWWSDKPIWEWDCLNSNDGGKYRTNWVMEMRFGGAQFNGIRGMLPESFTVIMDDADRLDLANSAMTGAFPHKITHHERWQEFGWNFIQVNLCNGGKIDYTDINLRLPDEEVLNYKEGSSTTLTELKKHKLSWLLHAGSDDKGENYSDIIPVEFMNKYLDYAPKGLGMIFVKDFWPNPDSEIDYKSNIENLEAHGVPKDIIYTDHFIAGKGLGGNGAGNMSLYDENGNLLWHVERDWDIPAAEYAEMLDPILREHLGEPVEHDPYVPEPPYTSSDYSKDGELMELQKASEGSGINVIFMGDGYVDLDMEEDGQYERDMRASMEYLFEIEPLKSLRTRFNVYAVKVVSPNKFGAYNGQQALNQDLNKAAEYISKVLPAVDIAQAHICIVENNSRSSFASGYTAMQDAGGSFAVIEEGGASSVIVHEVGGHGIGKLLDEYIYAGYEDNHTQPGAEESFRQWIKTDYHDKGWGMNISATDVPEDVPWAHMLKDEFYSRETSIYMGAWYWPYGLWRPSENSVMNNDYSHFNAPSREAIYKYVMRTSEGAEWTYDFETFKAWDMATQVAAGQQNRKASEAKKGSRVFEPAPVRRIIECDGRYETVPILPPGQKQSAPKAKHQVRTIERNGHLIRKIGGE